jgi:hypothetical protein
MTASPLTTGSRRGHVAGRVATSALMAGRDLARNRVAAVLLLAIPVLLLLLVYATTGEREIPFRLAAIGAGPLTGNEREMSLVFIALAAISGVSAYLGFLLLHRPLAADRRLVFEGYSPGELMLAKLVVVVAAAAVVAAYVAALLPLFARLSGMRGIFLGFLLGSLVYAAFGLVLGAAARRDVEGMLVILLVVNVDAGWLQNPVFFAHAHNHELIRLLPAHHPGQVAMISAFAEAGLGPSVVGSVSYALLLTAVAASVYLWRVRVER